MEICHAFNVKLVTSPSETFQQVLSHSSQLGGKKTFVVLEYDVIKSRLSILPWCKNTGKFELELKVPVLELRT